ncbi:MAG: hypothetical protein RSC75_12950 [Bacteroidales bacterium]
MLKKGIYENIINQQTERDMKEAKRELTPAGGSEGFNSATPNISLHILQPISSMPILCHISFLCIRLKKRGIYKLFY